MVDYILPVIRILGHFDRRVKKLPVSYIKRKGEFLYLVARIVYIKLPLGAVACPGKNLDNTSPRRAAGVAYVHGTCGVCAYKLNQHALTQSHVRMAVVFLLFLNILQDIGVVIGVKTEI